MTPSPTIFASAALFAAYAHGPTTTTTPQIFAAAGLFAEWGGAPVVSITIQGCRSCHLTTITSGDQIIDRYKTTRHGVSLVPYCPACYSYRPKEI